MAGVERVTTVVCLVSMALVVGCGGAPGAKRSEGARQVAYPAGPGERELAAVRLSGRSPTGTSHCLAGVNRIGSSRIATGALVTKHAIVRKAPDARAEVVVRLQPLNRHGLQEVLHVIAARFNAACTPVWYRVELSVLPNGTTGWARAWALKPFQVRSRIVIDVSERRLRLYRLGRLALETPVALGARATPTPLGRYFVNERYVLPDSSGPFGPNVLGISAHSDALQKVWVEDGPIGIHGTNEPQSIGRAASHGCVRVPNAVMRRLFTLAPAGTPVIVRT